MSRETENDLKTQPEPRIYGNNLISQKEKETTPTKAFNPFKQNLNPTPQTENISSLPSENKPFDDEFNSSEQTKSLKEIKQTNLPSNLCQIEEEFSQPVKRLSEVKERDEDDSLDEWDNFCAEDNPNELNEIEEQSPSSFPIPYAASSTQKIPTVKIELNQQSNVDTLKTKPTTGPKKLEKVVTSQSPESIPDEDEESPACTSNYRRNKSPPSLFVRKQIFHEARSSMGDIPKVKREKKFEKEMKKYGFNSCISEIQELNTYFDNEIGRNKSPSSNLERNRSLDYANFPSPSITQLETNNLGLNQPPLLKPSSETEDYAEKGSPRQIGEIRLSNHNLRQYENSDFSAKGNEVKKIKHVISPREVNKIKIEFPFERRARSFSPPKKDEKSKVFEAMRLKLPNVPIPDKIKSKPIIPKNTNFLMGAALQTPTLNLQYNPQTLPVKQGFYTFLNPSGQAMNFTSILGLNYNSNDYDTIAQYSDFKSSLADQNQIRFPFDNSYKNDNSKLKRGNESSGIINNDASKENQFIQQYGYEYDYEIDTNTVNLNGRDFKQEEEEEDKHKELTSDQIRAMVDEAYKKYMPDTGVKNEIVPHSREKHKVFEMISDEGVRISELEGVENVDERPSASKSTSLLPIVESGRERKEKEEEQNKRKTTGLVRNNDREGYICPPRTKSPISEGTQEATPIQSVICVPSFVPASNSILSTIEEMEERQIREMKNKNYIIDQDLNLNLIPNVSSSGRNVHHSRRNNFQEECESNNAGLSTSSTEEERILKVREAKHEPFSEYNQIHEVKKGASFAGNSHFELVAFSQHKNNDYQQQSSQLQRINLNQNIMNRPKVFIL